MKSSPEHESLSIGELAGRFGLATHVLRHWEDAGIIEPAERVNGRRRYTEAHVAKVTMILRCKQTGLSLADIRALTETPRDTHTDLLLEHRARLDEQIESIEAARALLDHMIACHADDATNCLEFQAVARAVAPAAASVRPG